MRSLSKHIILLICASFFLLAHPVYGQKDVDSILAAANKQIYENPDKAIILAQEAYNYPDASVKNKVNALLCISTAYSSKRDYKKSSEYIEHIKEFLPKIEDERQRMNILNRIAAHYQELQIYDKAIDYLDESLLLIEKYPHQDSVQSVLGYNATLRGFIYRKQMNCEIALKYFNKAIDAYGNTLHNPVMNANLSICYYNMGNCFLSLGKIEDAKTSYSSAVVYAKKIDAKSLIAFGQKGLAEAKTLEGDYKNAIFLLNNANQISESVGDLILNQGIYDGLSNNYLALHDWDNYMIFHNKFLALQNETKNSERKSINQSLINLTETKAEEINQINKRYKPFQIFLIILIVFALFILIRMVISEEKNLKKLQKKLKN